MRSCILKKAFVTRRAALPLGIVSLVMALAALPFSALAAPGSGC
jgi:hypothetical protein